MSDRDNKGRFQKGHNDCNCARNNNFSVEEMKVIGKAIKQVKENRKQIV